MLSALEDGVKGGVWFSLIDKVSSRRNLEAAARKVIANKGGAGVDRISVRQFQKRLPEEIEKLRIALRDGTYRPREIRRVFIPKPGSSGKRPLGIPTVRDRVVQTALRNVLEPIYERTFAKRSYGFRPQRGCKDALRRVNELLKAGYTWVIDADLKSYFDTIAHESLMERVRERATDGRVLALIECFLNQPVLEELSTWTPEIGTPQGAVISPLLANIYLNPLDHEMAEGGYEMVRYADDFVVLCKSKEEAHEALKQIQAWVKQAGLTLHPDKTKVVQVTTEQGIEFLGYHFRRSKRHSQRINRWPRAKSLKNLRDSIRPKTHRSNGHSLSYIIAAVNPTLRGWFGYYKHTQPTGTFRGVDSWVRQRLRSILRRRRKRKGRSRGTDHVRWPNTFFAKHGLFTLTAAHAVASQSSRR